jgi:alginate O-acetyltransferase complex protein AlgI
MSVPSLHFLLFALVAAVLFRLSSSRSWRMAVLLVTNLGFFATFISTSPVACLPFALFLLLGYVGMHRQHNRALGWLLVGAVVVMFFWLKKYTFVPGPLLLSFPYLTIGLSYVFFRVLHLVIDAQQDALPKRPGIVSYLNYTLNFTSLTSGPIQRYEDYHAFELAPEPMDPTSLGRSVERVVVGLFKVFIMSAALSAVQQHLIDQLPAAGSFVERWADGIEIVAIYPIYLYFNFSGYVDVVIGVASWFGLVLPENFNRPFQAENFLIFWTRWHITLSNWLKTYVYQPLLMSLMSRFPAKRYESTFVIFALFVTFFLVGAWHGQTTAFLFYGVLQGLGIGLNRLYQLAMQGRLGKKRFRELSANWIYKSCARGLTFTWFSFTLLWFWADWPQLAQFYRSLGAGAVAFGALGLFVGATICLAVWVALFNFALSIQWFGRPVLMSRYTRVMWDTALVAIFVGATFLLNAPTPPIVYKNF